MPEVTLRPLQRADFPMLSTWLREPLVEEWWHDDAGPGAIEERFGPSIDGSDPTRLRIALVDGEPVGFIQWYSYDDEPEYATELATLIEIPRGACSLDYLVGSGAWRGRGVGRAMIAAALGEIWQFGAADVIVAVHAANAASAAVLVANGFHEVAAGQLEPDNPALNGDHVVYRLIAVSAAPGLPATSPPQPEGCSRS